MMAAAMLGFAWIAFASTRRQRIYSGFLPDKIGMASVLVSVLMFISNFFGFFDQ